MNPLTRKLIAREFYMHRWLIGISMIAGLAGLALVARGGNMNFNVGFLVWLTTIVAFGAVIAMFGIATERKERVMHWVLSLPVAHGDYVRIKVAALLACFILPWFLLSAAAIGLIQGIVEARFRTEEYLFERHARAVPRVGRRHQGIDGDLIVLAVIDHLRDGAHVHAVDVAEQGAAIFDIAGQALVLQLPAHAVGAAAAIDVVDLDQRFLALFLGQVDDFAHLVIEVRPLFHHALEIGLRLEDQGIAEIVLRQMFQVGLSMFLAVRRAQT